MADGVKTCVTLGETPWEPDTDCVALCVWLDASACVGVAEVDIDSVDVCDDVAVGVKPPVTVWVGLVD